MLKTGSSLLQKRRLSLLEIPETKGRVVQYPLGGHAFGQVGTLG